MILDGAPISIIAYLTLWSAMWLYTASNGPYYFKHFKMNPCELVKLVKKTFLFPETTKNTDMQGICTWFYRTVKWLRATSKTYNCIENVIHGSSVREI